MGAPTNMAIYWVAVTTALMMAPCVAAAEGDSEFAFNLFSDLAPVLALFGEKFATQFASESLDWLDHLIFAMVPLGIVTAITAAIRVQGPRAAQAFIGLARENVASAEIELMSSTSNEVCELFNGKGIVRAMGKASIKQILVFPSVYKTEKEKLQEDDLRPAPTFRRGPVGDDVIHGKTDEESATESAPDLVHDKGAVETVDKAGYSSSGDGKEPDENDEMKALRRLGPPNLQLNHARPQSSEDERQAKLSVLCIAAIAVLLQLGLVAIAGLVTLHEGTRTSVGYELKSYGFPCYAAGSFALCLGMATCSYIIARSTTEWCWEPVDSLNATDSSARPHLFWVQKAQSVNDQTFSPYAISEGRILRVITSSRRGDSHQQAGGPKGRDSTPVADGAGAGPLGYLSERLQRNTWGAVTMLGVLTTGSGFILQFIGLRALPYPVSFAQLGGIVAMAIFRAMIRTRTRSPLRGFETVPRYELDFLASRIAFQEEFIGNEHVATVSGTDSKAKRHDWRVFTAGDLEDGYKFPFPVIATTTAPGPTDTQPGNCGTRSTEGHREPKVSSQQLLRVRQRLGASLALSRSIIYVLSEFIDDPRTLRIPKQDGSSDLKDDATICLNIALPTTRSKSPHSAVLVADEDWVRIRCFWQTNGNSNDKTVSGTWEVDQDSLDAVLSLWMAYVEETHPPGLQSAAADAGGKGLRQAGWFDPGATTPTYQFRRILGDDYYKSGTLKRDLSWWVDGFSEQMLTKDRDANVKLIIGFNGREVLDPTAHELAVDSCLPLPLILAQHLFTAFMWSIAKYLPSSCLGQGLPRNKQEVEVSQGGKFVPQQFRRTWSEPTLRQRSLTKVAQRIERTGLGDATEVLLCIVPPLSFADLLPNEVMLRMLPQKNPDCGWAEVADCYNNLLQSELGKSIEERFCYEAVVVTVDFLLVVSEPYEPYDDDEDTKPRDELQVALMTLANTLLSGYYKILGKLFKVYRLQRRFGDVIRALNRFGDVKRADQTIQDAIDSELQPRTIPKKSEVEDPPIYPVRYSWEEISQEFSAPNLSFSPGHLDILGILAGSHPDGSRGRRDPIKTYKTIAECMDEQDLFGWSPLHYTSLCQDSEIVKKIYGEVESKFKSNSGKRGILKLRDQWGRSPLHVAVRGGCYNNVQELLDLAEDSRAIAQLAGRDGLTPMHLAVKGGSEDCFTPLRRALRGTPVTQTDMWDREALHIAASLGHAKLCGILLDCRGHAEPEREDEMECTPLMYTLNILNKRRHSGEDSETESVKELERLVKKIIEHIQEDVRFRYKNGGTLLHLVAQYGDLKIFSEKAKGLGININKEDINEMNDDGRLPLHVAIMARKADNALFILKEMNEGSKINLEMTKTSEGLSAVAMACEMGLRPVVEQLLAIEDAVFFDDAENQRRSLLHFAVATSDENLAEGRKTVVDLLLQHAKFEPRDLRSEDKDGRTPLIAACISRFEYAVTKILEGAFKLSLAYQTSESTASQQDSENSSPPDEFRDMVNQRDGMYNQSALEYACELGEEKIVEALLEPRYKVTPNGAAEKWHRFTALHFAVGFAESEKESWRNIAKLLCDRVPEMLDKEDEYGRTPLFLADDGNQEELCRLILAHNNASYQLKEPFLMRALDDPSRDRISYIPGLIRSLGKKDEKKDDFPKIFGERDRIARLADRQSIAAWTDMALGRSMEGDNLLSVDIPCHFAIRGYEDNAIIGMIGRLEEHWERQEEGSRFERLTRPDLTGELGWSVVDWAKSFGVRGDVIKEIRDRYNLALTKLSSANKSEKRAEVASGGAKYVFDIPNTDQNLRNSGLLSGTGNSNMFSFDVKIIKWPPGGTLIIGFCGEFFPEGKDAKYPGKFYNSWGFEDRGMLYVEGEWDTISEQHDVDSCFEQGDTITVCLEPLSRDTSPGAARKVWYLKRSQNAKAAEFSPDGKDTVPLLSEDRFHKGKIYPCIGVDVTAQGVGLEIEVDFRNSRLPRT
ncbi:hypothetical protein B0T24DRAFT_671375 [Lasiosphaeria ovina]|uniref:Protein SSH4 n=1 Tax=Lasiosphaeria ovina TaxID=92902 RepID=A0AAE0JTX1_9PEZI|nr:hypothetical protein B0T24DRAFT_671375 [Lasiosphaeria ovina]